MSKIVTKNDNYQSFCQIKLDDGNRILISVAQTGIKVMKLKWAGMVPSGDIFDISTYDLFSDEYASARKKLTEKSLEPNMLDVFKDILLPCSSLEEVKQELDRIFK
jgi:hypothetical protein